MKPAAAKSSWSNLPADIVDLIAENLCYYGDYVDQINFRAVCKIWRSGSFPLKLAPIQPWLFFFRKYRYGYGDEDKKGLAYLYDTARKLKYTIKTGQIPFDATSQASKYGWVLFSKTKTTSQSVPSSVFFYNPFTAEIIELPELLMTSSDKATFSAAPTCSDCTIFVLRTYYRPKKICISTCKPGQKLWTRHSFDRFYGDVEGLVYTRGFLYCSFSNDVLVAFKESPKYWKTFRHEGIFPKPPCARYPTGLLIGSHGGNLLKLYYKWYNDQWDVFRYDWLKNKWFEVDNLDKQALFLGLGAGTSSISVPAVEEASELANTIHSAGSDTSCKCYFFKRTESKKLLCPESYYNWIRDCYSLMKIWIQPPILRGNYRSISNLLSVKPE